MAPPTRPADPTLVLPALEQPAPQRTPPNAGDDNRPQAPLQVQAHSAAPAKVASAQAEEPEQPEPLKTPVEQLTSTLRKDSREDAAMRTMPDPRAPDGGLTRDLPDMPSLRTPIRATEEKPLLTLASAESDTSIAPPPDEASLAPYVEHAPLLSQSASQQLPNPEFQIHEERREPVPLPEIKTQDQPPEQPPFVPHAQATGGPPVVIDAQHVQAQAPAREGSVRRALEDISFPPQSAEVRAEQEALQLEYLAWAEAAEAKRQEAFGPDINYRVDQNVTTPLSSTLLPATMGFIEGALSSLVRSTTTPYAAQAVAKGVHAGDAGGKATGAAFAGGVVGGIAAYLNENLVQTAIGRQLQQANMPTLEPVDVKALVPDASPVQLSLTTTEENETVKRFWRADQGAGTREANNSVATRSQSDLQAEVEQRRAELTARQNLLSGKGPMALTPPAVNGALAYVRDAVTRGPDDPTAGLKNGLFAALAGGTAQSMLDIAKGSPAARTDVASLKGDMQTVSLFKPGRPDPQQRAAGWRDIPGLPRSLLNIGTEAGALTMRAFAGDQWAATAQDALIRNGVSGGLSSTLSTAVSGFVAPTGEHRVERSSATVEGLQPFAQAFTSRQTWAASRELLKDSASPLTTSLDRSRSKEIAVLKQKLPTTRLDLAKQINALKERPGGLHALDLDAEVLTKLESLSERIGDGTQDLYEIAGLAEQIDQATGSSTTDREPSPLAAVNKSLSDVRKEQALLARLENRPDTSTGAAV